MKFHRLPLFFIISVVLLIGFGLATFYVASLAERYTLGHFGSYYSYFQKTLLLLGLSLIIAVMLQFVNYRVLRYLTIPAYVIGTGLLIAVLFFGTGAYGSRRWIPVAGSSGLQPSEIQKLVIILIVALILTLPQKRLTIGLKILLVIAAVIPSVLLVEKEPDLGSASLLLGISVIMLVHFRLTGRQLLVLGLVLALVGGGVWLGLRPYQRTRIETFLNPQADPLGNGYNVIQSIVATGSGGLWGRGIKGSTQAPLSFVPVQYADFVFSLVGELFGFAGCALLVLLFVMLLWSTFLVFRSLTDDFARYIVVGIGAMWFLQAAVNMGMTIGLSPVTGIPLPFISYGGSSLFTQVMAASIVVSVYRVRDELRF
ncbi:rod shape-determining protein RodA [Candidatus Cryosericum hinesii]|uniref:Cell wall polymerase n=1 Tax=Candidatus Cryosericum hinesii TaxID=2290915 RepID=A0A398DFF9_9BACT|nr:FtsW/RodA/SpoVE family cell cycle protein [Candidatus Cryosericum hinesii]RIE09921.1 rod shape-determining protein RodA [Candidatus Cryosericum hinesii]RIE13768.1 rod shape-determining protein RodA [Candidatus Cryosericum hinesii]RIE13835.1 rod shape-determining protein RodA [Candidatus Cryosericum hinesii]